MGQDIRRHRTAVYEVNRSELLRITAFTIKTQIAHITDSHFTALMLMTDGVSDAMFQSEKDLNDPDKWAEMYGKLRQGFPDDEIGGVDLTDDNEEAKDQLLGWLNFWSRGNHDDRTIAILY